MRGKSVRSPCRVRQTPRVTELEFWPDYGPGPLWDDEGKPVDLNSLGLDKGLVARVEAWNAEYAEDKIPVDGPGDLAWVRAGSQLLHDIRAALGTDYQVIVTEPWWGEEAT